MRSLAHEISREALIEWQQQRDFADDVLDRLRARARMDVRDRALVMEMFFGTLRNLGRLDFLISCLRDADVDDATRATLRLGLYQIFHMRIAPHAAVNQTVDIAGRSRGLVNAILRRALREERELREALENAPVHIRTSHPEFLIERWSRLLGPEAAAALAAWNNQPSPVFIRVNTLLTTPEELLPKLPDAKPTAHPLVFKIERLPTNALRDGLCYAQDPSTVIAPEFLAPEPGENVLDTCAAPGGKTSLLAALMKNQGRLVACDLWQSRTAMLRSNLDRLGVRNAHVHTLDMMAEGGPLDGERFDRILVDAPCSNTGVIRRRVDVRWRLTEEDFLRMPPQQFALVRRAAGLLKPGGTMVYSTCSIEPEENDQLVERAVAEIPGLRLVETRRTRPWEQQVDGSFAAKFIRE